MESGSRVAATACPVGCSSRKAGGDESFLPGRVAKKRKDVVVVVDDDDMMMAMDSSKQDMKFHGF